MPLLIEGGRIPTRWLEKKGSRGVAPVSDYLSAMNAVKIALVNNMPDPALEDTELQFFELLDAASGDLPIFVKLSSLPAVLRTERVQPHLKSFYFGLDDLWNDHVDAAIITGTEPRQPDLRQEPYWAELTQVMDWAERNTTSTVLSCLAAHAGVLNSDGIPRHRLNDKRFGVFDSKKVFEHTLTAQLASPVRFPHSRWNEVRADELHACGYAVLTESERAGVDVFVKNKGKSLFVHFQGHPEYGAQTLQKEYRRDIKRFLRGERETYPNMPEGYFDPGAAKALVDFEKRALQDRREEVMEHFPASAQGALESAWTSSAIGLYRNWLRYIISRKAEATAFPTASELYQPSGKRSAVP
ncbi:MAG TPA: homoserine O-succinyltransferase [Terriglobales bacterium]|nr:homoserine O-succinyltransferase [Terriglobales bacterium]